MSRLGLPSIATLLALCALTAGAAAQQDFPNRPMHVVIGFAAGGGADILTRWYAAKLAEASGQSVVVENRPGAIGVISAGYVAKAKADGYTMLFSGNTMFAGGRHLMKDFTFDWEKELVPAVAFLETPFLLAVGAKSPAKSIAELVALLKSKSQNKSGYTNPTGYLSTVLFKMRTGVVSEAVSYKITPDAVGDLADGNLDFMVIDGAFALGQVKNGRIRALAATTNKRITAFPDVPTMEEAGVPDYNLSPWWAVYLPAGTPPDIVGKIGGWMSEIARTPEAAKFLETFAALPVLGDQKFVRGRLADDRKTFDRLAEIGNLKPE